MEEEDGFSLEFEEESLEEEPLEEGPELGAFQEDFVLVLVFELLLVVLLLESEPALIKTIIIKINRATFHHVDFFF